MWLLQSVKVTGIILKAIKCVYLSDNVVVDIQCTCTQARESN